MELKDIVKNRREDIGISQAELAKLAGMSQSSVADLESGRNKGTKKLAELADALDLSMDEIRGISDSGDAGSLRKSIETKARTSGIRLDDLVSALFEISKAERRLKVELDLNDKAKAAVALYTAEKKDLSASNLVKILSSN